MSTGGPRNGAQRPNPPNNQPNNNPMNRGASNPGMSGHPLNAAATQFQPQTAPRHPDPYVHDMTVKLKEVMGVVQRLKHEHFVLRHDVDGLKQSQDALKAQVIFPKVDTKVTNFSSTEDPDDVELRKKFAELAAMKNGTPTPTPGKPKSDTVATVQQAVIKPIKEEKADYIPPHKRVAKGSTVRPVNAVNDDTRANGHVTFDAPIKNTPSTALPLGPRAPSDISSTTMANTPLPSVEDPYHVNSSPLWKPLFIRHLPELSPDQIGLIPTPSATQTFSLDFIKATFGGNSWSPGMFFIPHTAERCPLPGRTYYLLDARYDPYLPSHPGQHGAKLTPFFNENPLDDAADAAYLDVPVFICASPSAVDENKGRYVYFGHYSQTRWSDRLDYDRLTENVGREVKMYWAEELSARGRAQWLTDALKTHFWPKPTYDGKVLKPSAVEPGSQDFKDILNNFKTFMQELSDWETEAQENVESLKKEDILQAFERPDADEVPGLRLWWEYFQCVGWKRDFYDFLVKEARGCPNP